MSIRLRETVRCRRMVTWLGGIDHQSKVGRQSDKWQVQRIAHARLLNWRVRQRRGLWLGTKLGVTLLVTDYRHAGHLSLYMTFNETRLPAANIALWPLQNACRAREVGRCMRVGDPGVQLPVYTCRRPADTSVSRRQLLSINDCDDVGGRCLSSAGRLCVTW